MSKSHKVYLRIINDTSHEMTAPSAWFSEGRLADGESWPQRIGPGETKDIRGYERDNDPIYGCSFYVEYTLNGARLTVAVSNPGGGVNKAAVGLGGKSLWADGARMNDHGYHAFQERFELDGKKFSADCTCTSGKNNDVVVRITEDGAPLAKQWIAGDAFRYWEVHIDQHGKTALPHQVTALTAGAVEAQLTDIFVFVHGMSNTPIDARAIYDAYFQAMRSVADERGIDRSRIGVCGIMWPSGGGLLDALGEAAGAVFSAGGGVYDRAKAVGKDGLAAVLDALARLSNLRTNVVAHSMGTVAAAYSLQAIRTPVESMFLIQGALWSRSFDADGDLRDLKNKVKGYIVATTSKAEDEVNWMVKDRLATNGFTSSYKSTIAVRDATNAALCGKKFVDFNCDGVINGHNDYKKPEVARAHWAMLPF